MSAEQMWDDAQAILRTVDNLRETIKALESERCALLEKWQILATDSHALEIERDQLIAANKNLARSYRMYKHHRRHVYIMG